MERHFDQLLEKLKTRLIKMCSLIDEQVEFAVQSTVEGNIELANLVVQRDEKVDKKDRKIENLCLKLFALNQPVAVDLRMIISALQINSNLERIGDLSTNIAENVIACGKTPPFLRDVRFNEIAAVTQEMVKSAIDAFIGNNALLAKEIIKKDSVLDDLFKNGTDILTGLMKQHPDQIEHAIRTYSTLHEMERIGDHATNIAEMVYFMVEAQNIKHKYEEFIFKSIDESEEKPQADSKSETSQPEI